MARWDFEVPDVDSLEEEVLGALVGTERVTPDDLAWLEANLEEEADPGEEASIPQWLPWDLPDIPGRYGA